MLQDAEKYVRDIYFVSCKSRGNKNNGAINTPCLAQYAQNFFTRIQFSKLEVEKKIKQLKYLSCPQLSY
jgi:hypothetical protein